jgi:hypothetical protein
VIKKIEKERQKKSEKNRDRPVGAIPLLNNLGCTEICDKKDRKKKKYKK